MTPTMKATTTPTELVRSLFEAFSRGDIAFVLRHTAPDCRWVSEGEGIPVAGVYNGPNGVARFFQTLDATEQITRLEMTEYFTNGDSLIALGHEDCKVKVTGKSVSSPIAMLFRVRDGLVTEWHGFYNTAAWAEAHRA